MSTPLKTGVLSPLALRTFPRCRGNPASCGVPLLSFGHFPRYRGNQPRTARKRRVTKYAPLCPRRAPFVLRTFSPLPGKSSPNCAAEKTRGILYLALLFYRIRNCLLLSRATFVGFKFIHWAKRHASFYSKLRTTVCWLSVFLLRPSTT